MSTAVTIENETNLAGVLTSSLSTTGLSFTARFFDSKTGEARTPQSTTLDLVINKGNQKFERVRLTTHTTVSGDTTCTIAGTGRAVPLFGVGAGGAAGNAHNIGDSIGSIVVHETISQLNAVIDGTVGTGARIFRIGDETDNDIYIVAQNADGSRPFLAYFAASNAWVFSNDGTSSTAIGSGASVYVEGDGVSITASNISIDLTDTVIFKTARTGNEARAVVTDILTGKIDPTFITASLLATYISDLTSTSAEIDKMVDDSLPEFTTGEAIDGSTTPQACALLAGTMYKQVTSYNSSPTTLNLGQATTNARLGQSFVITDDDASSLLMQYVNFICTKASSPTDDMYVEIQSDSGSDAPSGSVITNGTSNTVAGGTLTASTSQNVKFTFATPPTIVSGTKYWFVLRRSGAVDATNYFRPLGSATSVYSGGHQSTYDSTPGTWTDNAPADILFHAVYTATYSTPKLMKADADSLSVAKFLGFTKSNVADGGTAVLQVSGAVRGFPGASFTPGQPYYLDTTAGGVTATMPTTYATSITPTIIQEVGEAISATALLIRPKTRAILNFGTLGWSPTTTTSGTADVLIETAFKPTKIRLKFYFDANAGADDVVDLTYHGTQKTDEVTVKALNASSQTVSATTVITKNAGSPYADRVKVQAVYQNGFLLRFSDVRASDILSQLYIEIE